MRARGGWGGGTRQAINKPSSQRNNDNHPNKHGSAFPLLLHRTPLPAVLIYKKHAQHHILYEVMRQTSSFSSPPTLDILNYFQAVPSNSLPPDLEYVYSIMKKRTWSSALRSGGGSAESRSATVGASAISTVSRSGVSPRASGRHTLAPEWTRRRAAACWSLATARWSGVIPADSFLASTFSFLFRNGGNKKKKKRSWGVGYHRTK